jgi:hypothetical protein
MSRICPVERGYEIYDHDPESIDIWEAHAKTLRRARRIAADLRRKLNYSTRIWCPFTGWEETHAPAR